MQIKKSDAHTLKEQNTKLVLSTLLAMKAATRRQLAQRTGLSQPTVNTIVQEMEDNGFVYPGAFAASASGRRPQNYAFREDRLRAVTIRMLAQSLEYTVATADGAVVLRNSWKVMGEETHIIALQSLLQTLLKQDKEIQLVAIGVPGVAGPGGVLHAIPQIPTLEDVALSHILNKQFGLPIYVENDMNLVALGSIESEFGQTTSQDIVFIHLGEGLGAGIVMGGRIIRGFSGFSGETAYITMQNGNVGEGETLETLFPKAKNPAQQAQLIFGMIANIICLINPPIISFGSIYATEELLRHLRRKCEKHLPLWALPTFSLTENEDAAYDRGLKSLVRNVLIDQIIHEMFV